jgi:magnesium chelatase accessory protein
MTVNCNRHFKNFLAMGAPPAALPANWPHRASSRMVAVGRLNWHVQGHFPAQESGAAPRPTLLMLHGTGASTHSWAELIPTLSEFATIVSPDLPGHGFTTGADRQSLTLNGMATALHELLLALQIEGPVAVVGHSAGAPLAIQWALDHCADPKLPFELCHLIGLNPSLVPPPPLYTRMLGPMVAPIATSGPITQFLAGIAARTGMVKQLLQSTQSEVPESQRQHYQFLFARPSHVQGAMGFMAGADLPALLARGRSLTVPTTFLIGKKDSWVREQPLKQVIADSFPNARVITWQGGHLLHEEQPLNVARLIESIISPSSA